MTDHERDRLMAEQERLLRVGVPIEALERLTDVTDPPAAPGLSLQATTSQEGREERWAEAINVPGLNEAVPLATALAIMSRCIRLADAEVAAAIQAALPRPPLPAGWRETLAARIEADTDDSDSVDGPEYAAGMRRAAYMVRHEDLP